MNVSPRRYFPKAIQRQTAQEAAPGPIPVVRRGRGSRCLSYQDIFLVLQLEASGKSTRQIAKVMGVNPETVRKVILEFQDTKPLAKRRLDAAADQLARTALDASRVAAEAGDGDIALELLDRLDVAPKRRDERESSTKVMVVVGRADPSALPDFSHLSLPPATS